MENVSYITSFYYNDANGILLMVDLSSENGLKNLSNWLEPIKLYEPKETKDQPIMFLVGTKADLPQVISDEEMNKTATGIETKYFKVSSVNNTGVNEVIKQLLDDMNAKFEIEKDIKKPSLCPCSII
ncbi:Sphingomyelin phosphodiesterase [Entamoeba marina]